MNLIKPRLVCLEGIIVAGVTQLIPVLSNKNKKSFTPVPFYTLKCPKTHWTEKICHHHFLFCN